MKWALFQIAFLLLMLLKPSDVQTNMLKARAGCSCNLRTLQTESENIQLRVGRIVVEGANACTPQEIIRIIRIKNGERLNEEQLRLIRNRLEDAYQQRGYIMVKVFIEKNVRGVADNSGVHLADLKIQIQEGQQFFVRRVECAGNKTVRDDLIWRTLGLKIGLPFNPKDIEKSIKRLDRLGKFEKINREDVEISVNEVEHFVDVAFYLKEKVRQ